MAIDYSHALNTHTRKGAEVGYQFIAAHITGPIKSLIDVGCGTGPWLRAAIDSGVSDVAGIDGVIASVHQLQVDPSLIQKCDLTDTLDVGKRFDVALCLEVAEHLAAEHGPRLVNSLTRLADTIVFSAACPDQPGQHHVNCQWPEYWQTLFNDNGFACDDQIRWAMWNETAVEPWYRQNIFIARRCTDFAGREPRIRPVLHPEMVLPLSQARESQLHQARSIEDGSMPIQWYFCAAASGLVGKLRRRLRKIDFLNGYRGREAAK